MQSLNLNKQQISLEAESDFEDPDLYLDHDLDSRAFTKKHKIAEVMQPESKPRTHSPGLTLWLHNFCSFVS